MKGIGYLIAAVGVFTVALSLPSHSVKAQNTHSMNHSVAPENVIDGSAHPERINDADAYRMFFLAAIVKDTSPEETSRQLDMFNSLQLNDKESVLISQIVADFASEVDTATQTFNTAAETDVPSESPSVKEYNKQIKGFVQEAVAKIQLLVGNQRAVLFHGHIQNEKQNMRIAVED